MRDRRAARAVGAAALTLMAGNLTGSILGFARQSIITKVFGFGAGTDAFFATSVIPQMFYDLTIGAAVSAALIPSLTSILEREGVEDFRQVLGQILVLAWVVLALMVVALVLLAGPLINLLLGTQHCGHQHDLRLAVTIARILIPTLFFLGTSAVFLSGLYALRHFRVPAFANSFYHLGVIGGAVLLARPLGILALPVGALAGSAAQAAVQLPPLVAAGAIPRPQLRLSPAVRQIIRLYLPVAAGLFISVAGQIIDINLKWRLQCGGVTAMQLATTLTQFPIGIAVAALSFAVLPSISSDASAGRLEDFKDTLAAGMRFVLFLTIPAALGYIALASPVVSLVFGRGLVTSHDVARTATALIGYALQIPFVGIDQLLIFAFYARKNTVTPMLVGIMGVAVYLGTALILMPRYHILGLALANSIQNAAHALVLGVLLFLSIGALQRRGLLRSVGKSAVAGLVMAVVAAGSVRWLDTVFGASAIGSRGIETLAPIALGAALYIGVSWLLRNPELGLVISLVRRSALPGGER